MSKAPSMRGSRAGSVAGSATHSRAASQSGSRAGSGQSSAANSAAASHASSPHQSAEAQSAAASQAPSGATSAVGSAAGSNVPSAAISLSQSGAGSRAVSPTPAEHARAQQAAGGGDRKPEQRAHQGGGAQANPRSRGRLKTPEKAARSLKSRAEWDKEQRLREQSRAEHIARRQRAAQHLKQLQERIAVCDIEYAATKAAGNAVEGIQWLERSLWLRRDCHGIGHEEVDKCAQTLVGDLNIVGMAALQKNDCALAHELLLKGLLLTAAAGSAEGSGLIQEEEARRRLRAVTYNNLGCFFRKRGKLHAALQVLDKALRLELLSEQVDTPAVTHLNMSAVLSQLGKHRAAMQHAECAVALLHEVGDPRGVSGLVQALEKRPPMLLSVAFHSVATQAEFLADEPNGDSERALEMYAKAAEAAGKCWGETHVQAQKMQQEYRAAAARLFPPEPAVDAAVPPRRPGLARGRRESGTLGGEGEDSGDEGEQRVGRALAEGRSKLPAVKGARRAGGGSGLLQDGGKTVDGKKVEGRIVRDAKRQTLKGLMMDEPLPHDSSVSPHRSPERAGGGATWAGDGGECGGA